MNKKTSDEKNKNGSSKYIIFSIVLADLLVLDIIAALYFMTSNIANIIVLIISAVIGIALTTLLVLCFVGMSGENKKVNNSYYNNQLKTLRAIYLMMKKNTLCIEDTQNKITSSMDALSREMLLNQKAASKYIVSRNKENTDALMNSNDIILEKVLAIVSEINKTPATSASDNSLDLAEIKAKLEEISTAISNGVSVAVPDLQGLEMPNLDISDIEMPSLDMLDMETANLDIPNMEMSDMDEENLDIPNLDIPDFEPEFTESVEENSDVILKGLEEILETEGLKESPDDDVPDDELPDLDELLAMTDILPDEDELDSAIEDIPIFVPEMTEEVMESIAPETEAEPVVEPVPAMGSTPVSLGDMDSNEKMTPEQIAQLIASMTS